MKAPNALLYGAILSALLIPDRAPAQPPPVSFVATHTKSASGAGST